MNEDQSKLRTYISSTITLLVTELRAVFNKTEGDTITEYVKSNPLSHGLMMALLVWGVFHFAVSTGTGAALNIGIAAAGFVAGIVAWAVSPARKK